MGRLLDTETELLAQRALWQRESEDPSLRVAAEYPIEALREKPGG